MYIFNNMKKWRKKYKTQFEIFKYILIYYIYNRKVKSNASIIINKIKIKLLKKIKYLEIIFNQELWFKSYLQYIIKKDINMIIILSSIIKII